MNPDALDPRDGVLTTIVAGLRSHPWLSPITVADAFTQVPAAENRDGTQVTRELESYEPPAAPVSQPVYDATTSRVNASPRSRRGRERRECGAATPTGLGVVGVGRP